jgi:acyl-CoA synthetase (AMP-forming)/AMP-acid ligase II
MLDRVAREAAARWGDAAAYVAPSGWALSYADLDLLSDEVAAGFSARGLGEGDVVALVLPPVPEFVVAYLAAAKIGAVTAGVNPRLTDEERGRVLDAAEPALVLDTTVLSPASTTAECLEAFRVQGARPAPLAEDPARPIAIVFTSGTTGTPKGAVYGGSQLEAITAVDTGWRWGGGGASLAATTFAHLGPMTKLPGVMVRGGTTHLLERWRASDALDMIERHRMPGIGGIPTQVALMLSDPTFADRDVSSVQAIVMGGGPATPALVRAARDGFGAAVSVRYSCTEAGVGTGTAFTDPPEDAEVTVGRPQPGVELLLLDEADEPVAVGEVGAVCFRSAAIMTGYWRAPDLTAAAVVGSGPASGAVRTGDLGWVDEAGRLRLVGRAKEMYVRGGENVYPMEIESVLASHPAVSEVAVVPRGDDVWGEVGVAVIVARDAANPPSLATLRAHAGTHLASFKLPDEIVVVDALPLTPMEKVDRRALSELVKAG